MVAVRSGQINSQRATDGFGQIRAEVSRIFFCVVDPDDAWNQRRIEIAEIIMAPRAYWRGTLKLSLVTCPIALYPASTQAEKTHFHQINIKTGNRLKQQMVDVKTGRVVERDDKGRG